MIKTIALFSLVLTVVAAQSSTSLSSAPTPSSTGNPLIPTSISSSCASFMSTLDADSGLDQCLQPIISATASFGPTSNTTGTGDVDSALNGFCNMPSGSCDVTSIRALLANFYSSCSNEILNPSQGSNEQVAQLYELLYLFVPLTSAICTRDTNGTSCLNSIQASLSTTSSSASSPPSQNARRDLSSFGTSMRNLLDNYLYISKPAASGSKKRAVATTTVVSTEESILAPNFTTFGVTNLIFMFLNSSMPSSVLCGSCALNIMTAYVQYESMVAFAPAIPNGKIIAGQVPLYQAMQNKCGDQFLGGTVQAAGGLSSGSTSAGLKSFSIETPMMMGTILALLIGLLGYML